MSDLAGELRRRFPHAPLAPIVERPDAATLPGYGTARRMPSGAVVVLVEHASLTLGG